MSSLSFQPAEGPGDDSRDAWITLPFVLENLSASRDFVPKAEDSFRKA
jgi:hypothetical protein